MKSTTILLAQILSCGYADIDFIDTEMDSFSVDVDDLDIDEMIQGGYLSANSILEKIYLTVVNRHEIDESRYSIFTNCLDSHLNIDNEEMYSESDVIAKKVETAEESE